MCVTLDFVFLHEISMACPVTALPRRTSTMADSSASPLWRRANATSALPRQTPSEGLFNFSSPRCTPAYQMNAVSVLLSCTSRSSRTTVAPNDARIIGNREQRTVPYEGRRTFLDTSYHLWPENKAIEIPKKIQLPGAGEHVKKASNVQVDDQEPQSPSSRGRVTFTGVLFVAADNHRESF